MTNRETGSLLRTSLGNASIRGVTLATKLIFLILAAKRFTVEGMAVYGLMTTSVSIAVTAIGLEFYAFSTREILAREDGARARYLRDQLAFHAAAYVVLLPASLPIFWSGLLPWSLFGWFVALSIGEHLAQEIARVFNTLFRPVLSTVLFFIRSAAWCIAVVALWVWKPSSVTVVTVFVSWFAGIAVSIALAIRELARMDWRPARSTAVDWRWIRRGILVAAPFLVSSASYRVTELADRYIIHFLLDDRAVGVYSFYGTLANVLPALVGATLSAVLVPRIIHAHQQNDGARYRAHFRTLSWGTVGLVVTSVPIVFFAVMAILPYISRAEYGAELPTFAVLLVSGAVGAVAQLPGVGLYARRRDRALLVAVLLGAIINTALNFWLIPKLGIIGAAWATTLAYAVMGAFQIYCLKSRSWGNPTNVCATS